MQTRAFASKELAHFRFALGSAAAKKINVPFLIAHDCQSFG
jgi:hypothetical protein